MKAIAFSILAIALIQNRGCSDSSNTEENASKQSIQDTMVMEGYSKGVVSLSQIESECEYSLVLQESRELLDPINLTDFIVPKAEIQVWVKTHDLRRANRCAGMRPVQIIDIKKREAE